MIEALTLRACRFSEPISFTPDNGIELKYLEGALTQVLVRELLPF
jgi:hypothetical protein